MSADGSDGNASRSSSGKTLSKRLLYLPLIAYELSSTSGDGNKSGDPTTYLDNRKSLPSSVQEKALVNFWHKVGVEYHQNQATVRDPKNNGNRPISLRDLEDRIRQRALTLVGGGINSGWDTSAGAVANGGGGQNAALSDQDKGETIKKKKRKRSQSVMTFIAPHDTGGRIVSQFLQELNALWNDYIYQLFQLLPPPSSLKSNGAPISISTYYSALTNSTSFWARVTSCISNGNTQLMGAKVRIKTCRHSPSWVGRTGYLVGSTSATWSVMVEERAPKKKKKRRRGKNLVNEVYESSSSKVDEKQNREHSWKSIVVPKRGSTIALLIPLAADRNDATRARATPPPARDDLPEKDNTDTRLPLVDGNSMDTNETKLPFLVIHLEEA